MALVSQRWPDPHFPRKMPKKRPSRPEIVQLQERNPKIIAKYPTKLRSQTPLRTPQYTWRFTPNHPLNRNYIRNWVIFVYFSVSLRHFSVLEGDWGCIECILGVEGVLYFVCVWGVHDRNQKRHLGFEGVFYLVFLRDSLGDVKNTSKGFLEWSRRITLRFP